MNGSQYSHSNMMRSYSCMGLFWSTNPSLKTLGRRVKDLTPLRLTQWEKKRQNRALALTGHDGIHQGRTVPLQCTGTFPLEWSKH